VPGRALRWGRSVVCAVCGWLLAIAAHAQLSGTVALDSDYRYRGVSLSNSKPSLRLTLNYDAPEHWYAGASTTRATLLGHEAYTQLLGYAGWVSSAVDGRSVEIGIDGSDFAGISGYDFAELYVGLLANDWSARAYYAPNYYGRGVGVGYLELNAHVPVDERARLFAHVGALSSLNATAKGAGRTRGDVSVGAGFVVRGWDFHLAAVAATRGGPYPAVYDGRRAAVVAGVSYSF